MARAEPFSVCASAAASEGMAASGRDQPGRLGREHRQHLLLESGIAERHAFEVVEIDRAIIGDERRRWHPFNPFEMKRHGGTQIALPQPFPRGPISRANTRLVNGTFSNFAPTLSRFGPYTAVIHTPYEKSVYP